MYNPAECRQAIQREADSVWMTEEFSKSLDGEYHIVQFANALLEGGRAKPWLVVKSSAGGKTSPLFAKYFVESSAHRQACLGGSFRSLPCTGRIKPKGYAIAKRGKSADTRRS
ncbi:MAG: hypothetical protein AAF293_06395 [Pseudomonadota bacterium]